MRLLALSPALAALAALASPAHARICAISGLDGAPTEIWRDGSWVDAGLGRLPKADLILRTGPEARVEITCDDAMIVTVGTMTEVNLETLANPVQGSRDVIVQLIHGIIGLVAAKRPGRSVAVRTPLAIAAARSTEWLAQVEGGASAVFVRTGAVAVRPVIGPTTDTATATATATATEVVLHATEGLTASAPGTLGPRTVWTAERVSRTRAALGFGWR
ncbi:MAG: hypothetical protein ACI9ZH_002495 [Paracoccaceae bacterium]|jgi:hypothetical protein